MNKKERGGELLLCDGPVLDGASLEVEEDAGLYHFVSFCLVGQGIVSGVYLSQCFGGGAIGFQFEHVGGVGHLDNHVDAPTTAFHLGADIYIKHRENQIEGVFVEAFCCGGFCQFFLEAFHVGDAGQIGLHLAQGKVEVVFFQGTPELQGKTNLHVASLQTCVGGQQPIDIANTNFSVGNGKRVDV